jgi:hypothetical protein
VISNIIYNKRPRYKYTIVKEKCDDYIELINYLGVDKFNDLYKIKKINNNYQFIIKTIDCSNFCGFDIINDYYGILKREMENNNNMLIMTN